MSAMIKVEVSSPSPAMFRDEREVSFHADGKSRSFVVDTACLEGDLLKVHVIEGGGDTTLIHVPGWSLGPSRVRIESNRIVWGLR